MQNKWAKQKAFTIVELLIVIVVIGVLATITVVAYNGIQARANNSKITSAAVTLEKAIRLWHSETGTQPNTGGNSTAAMPANPVNGEACPGSTTAGGWVGKGAYHCGLEDLLLAYKMIPATLIPSVPPNKIINNSPTTTFMFYRCTLMPNAYILMWYLENPSTSDVSNFDNQWRRCSNDPAAMSSSSLYYVNYGMRNGKMITLSS